MREIVDKHFADNWVLPYYMGKLVDLTLAWDHFKAAKTALNNTLFSENIKEIVEKYQGKLAECTKKTKEFLSEGSLNEDFILDKVNSLLQVIRDANVCIRWVILHRMTFYKKALEMITPVFPKDKILTLLLYTSQFEFLLKR